MENSNINLYSGHKNIQPKYYDQIGIQTVWKQVPSLMLPTKLLTLSLPYIENKTIFGHKRNQIGQTAHSIEVHRMLCVNSHRQCNLMCQPPCSFVKEVWWTDPAGGNVYQLSWWNTIIWNTFGKQRYTEHSVHCYG